MKSIRSNLKFLSFVIGLALISWFFFGSVNLSGNALGAGLATLTATFIVVAVGIPISLIWAAVNCYRHVDRSLVRDHPVACGLTILQTAILAGGVAFCLYELLPYLLFDLAVWL